MKRRSVTFTDNPPEVIGDNNASDKLYFHLPIGNSSLWLHLTKFAHRPRTFFVNNQKHFHRQQIRYSRSVPDLSKYNYCLSTSTNYGASSLNTITGENLRKSEVFLPKQHTDPISLSTPYISTNSQHLMKERVCRYVVSDRSNQSWKKEKHQLSQRYTSVLNYQLYRRWIGMPTAAKPSSTGNNVDDSNNSHNAHSVRKGSQRSNDDNNFDIVSKEIPARNYKSSSHDELNCNESNTAIVDANSAILDNCAKSITDKDREGIGIIANYTFHDDENDVKNDCHELAEQFPHCSIRSSNERKTLHITPASINCSRRRNNGDFSRSFYSFLKKQLNKSHYNYHNTMNTAFSIKNSMKNVASNQERYHNLTLNAKLQRQLVDGNFPYFFGREKVVEKHSYRY